MTIENKTDLFRRNQNWESDARRYRERRECSNQPEAILDAGDEAIFPSITPPPIWPRVFPGL